MSIILTPAESLGVTPYKVAVPLVAIFFILYAWNHVSRGTKTIWEALLWTLFWGAVCVVVLFPSWIGFLTAWTGIKGQANAVFAIVLGILLFIIFHILVRLEKMQHRITLLAQHEALEDAGLTGSTKHHPSTSLRTSAPSTKEIQNPKHQ